MFRQAVVHKSVIGIEQRQHAAVFAKNAFEQQLRLMPERLADVPGHLRGSAFHFPQRQPLAREIIHQRLRAAIRQHPAGLLRQHSRLMQLPGHGELQKFVIGNAAP